MLIPGTLLAQTYKICHLIAEGGLAEIYLALNDDAEKKEPRWIAIKRLKPAFCHDRDITRWFKEEAQIISSLRHPLLVQGYRLIEENSELFIIMEYVSGQSLSDLSITIAQYPMALRVQLVIALGIALCDALSHIHQEKDKHGVARGLIHSDISSQNIMVCFDGHIKLVDFGNAMDISSARASSSRFVCINERYMAPELRHGLKIGRASDIYSAGIVLLEILAAKGRFERHNKKLAHILQKATHQEIEQRYQDCASLQIDLQSLGAELQVKDSATILKNLAMRRSIKKISHFVSKLWGPPLITAFSLLTCIFVISVLQILKA